MKSFFALAVVAVMQVQGQVKECETDVVCGEFQIQDADSCKCVCDLVCAMIYSIRDDCTCGPIKGLECDAQYNGEFDEEYGCIDGVPSLKVEDTGVSGDTEVVEGSKASYLDLCAMTMSATALMLALN